MTEAWKEETWTEYRREFEEHELPPDPADDFEWTPATAEVAGDLPDPPLGTWRERGASRRDFLRGVVCSGVAVSAAAYMFSAGTGEARAATRGVERLVSLNVNGRIRRVDVPPGETLAQTIRYRLGLTGTKIGCNRAECGACTVMADDVTIYSCSTLTHQARGRKIVTVEGVADPSGRLHPVQQAFIDELGPQCGFCTPGQVVSAVALLKRNPRPTADEARRAMSGNLCRCGAYANYLNGVMRVAGRI